MTDAGTKQAATKLREAVKRLINAINKPAVEVTVLRQDIELLLAVWNKLP